MCWIAWKVLIERPNWTRCLQYRRRWPDLVGGAGHLHGASPPPARGAIGVTGEAPELDAALSKVTVP
jgi:hypothetical protein